MHFSRCFAQALPDFQTIINSTSSFSRGHSPFFLTYFRHPHFPFQHLSNRDRNLNEHSTVDFRLNISQQTLKEAAEHVEAHHHLTKAQFDKNVKEREFPIGCKVFVQTSQRAGLSKKLARPYKGPFICLEELSNGNLRLAPMNGGRTISVHKNHCKLAPHRLQHPNFNDLDSETPEENEETPSPPY